MKIVILLLGQLIWVDINSGKDKDDHHFFEENMGVKI